MRFAPIALISAFLACGAFARMGETLEQCEARYGSPEKIEPPNPEFMLPDAVYVFSKDGVRIRVSFLGGVAQRITYSRPDSSDPQDYAKASDLSRSQVEEIVARNVGEGNFSLTEDGSTLSGSSNDKNVTIRYAHKTLILKTEAYLERELAASREAEQKQVEGL